VKIDELDGISGVKDCISGVTSFLSECIGSRYHNRSVLNLNMNISVQDFVDDAGDYDN